MEILYAVLELTLAVAAGLTVLAALGIGLICLIAYGIHEGMERGRLS